MLTDAQRDRHGADERLGALDRPQIDQAGASSPLGRERPAAGQVGGHGLWLANQLCDLVQVRSFPTGSAVRLHMRLEA